jgi:hypothetical protein
MIRWSCPFILFYLTSDFLLHENDVIFIYHFDFTRYTIKKSILGDWWTMISQVAHQCCPHRQSCPLHRFFPCCSIHLHRPLHCSCLLRLERLQTAWLPHQLPAARSGSFDVLWGWPTVCEQTPRGTRGPCHKPFSGPPVIEGACQPVVE